MTDVDPKVFTDEIVRMVQPFSADHTHDCLATVTLRISEWVAIVAALRSKSPAKPGPSQAEGWQPIETAPCERALLYFPAKQTGSRNQMTLPKMTVLGCVKDFPHRRPTHWMPIPLPPKEPAR